MRCLVLCLAGMLATACSAPVVELRAELDAGRAEAALAAAVAVGDRGWWVRGSNRAAAYRVAGDAATALGRRGESLSYYGRALDLDPTLTDAVLPPLRAAAREAMADPAASGLAVTLLGFIDRRLALDPSAAEFLAARRPAADNLVLLGLDTLRADHLGCYGYPVATSPAIDRLAAQGLRFEHAFAASPWTCPSFLSAFTGLPPLAHGSYHYPQPLHLPPGVPTLAGELQRAALVTAAFTEGGFARPEYGLEQGFDLFPEDVGWVSGGLQVDDPLSFNVERAVRFMDRHRHGRFALWLHSYATHVPLHPRPELRRALGPDWTARTRGLLPADRDLSIEARQRWRAAYGRELLAPPKMLHEHIQRYDAAVLAVDRAVARLLAELERLDLSRRTLVVFLADHGEGLTDHGLLEHGRNYYTELTRVPLIWRQPGAAPAVVAEAVSLMGLPATVLASLGCDDSRLRSAFAEPYRAVVGGSAAADGAILMQGLAVVDGERRASAAVCWPYHLVAHADGRRELYHLIDDPQELHDLAAERPAERARCEALWLEQGAEAEAMGERLRAAGTAPPVVVDEATRAQLEALGYADSP